MRLILVRHGETAWTETGRYQGWTDTPLSPQGRATARRIGEALRQGGLTRFELWASDLQRAACTARLAFGRRPRIDQRLRELDFGIFAGRTYEENLKRFGRRFEAWTEHEGRPTPPGCESLEDFVDRTGDWLREVRASGPDRRTVIAVTHGGVVRALLRLHGGGAHHPRTGEVTTLRWDHGRSRPSVRRTLPGEDP